MLQPLAKPRPTRRRRSRTRIHNERPSRSKAQRVDAASLAAKLQIQEEKREYFYSLIALCMKLGFLVLFSASLIKVSIASTQRVKRHLEILSVLDYESAKLEKLKNRFDGLFTIGGAQRFMDEQEQWIAPNSVRVIWR